MKWFNWDKTPWFLEPANLIPGIASLVTVDQWTASTGAADPIQIPLAFSTTPFSVMAAARGIAIVLTVAYTLNRIRAMRVSANPNDRALFRIVTGCIVALLATEALVITPYTMTVMANTPTGITLIELKTFGQPVLFWVWALFVSDAALLAVVTSGLASFVVDKVPEVKATRKPVVKPIPETSDTTPIVITPSITPTEPTAPEKINNPFPRTPLEIARAKRLSGQS